MSDYQRSTRACAISQIRSELSQAIREYFQLHQLGDPQAATLACCETISARDNDGNPGSFLNRLMHAGPDTTFHLAILLTADWLVWGRWGDRSQTVVTGARLKVIKVKAFVTRRTKDMQLEISGFVNDSREVVRGNLELGPEPAAQKFCDQVLEAVNRENPPAKRALSRWFGG